jgi:hypothetical protein
MVVVTVMVVVMVMVMVLPSVPAHSTMMTVT